MHAHCTSLSLTHTCILTATASCFTANWLLEVHAEPKHREPVGFMSNVVVSGTWHRLVAKKQIHCLAQTWIQ